ncbi:cobyric acid synthase [Leifsonia sp. PS1209]|uniref:type 1 glutamine amidotransferase n=1 Tax=Leifsonia sp. PS1209 TaxID=2724914 RepID=UPI001442C609|nr:cobyric acid synthase [Leifsonia sp. PS1209]QIZ99025.1 cobyric acid synthase [Leifsonia sp. PS1209]
MSVLRILHLYPAELGINGDAGNVTALVERARWRGIDAEVVRHPVGGVLPESVDIVHIGSGPLSSQRAVLADVQRIAPALRDWRDAGIPILAIAGGWQLLGTELVTADGERLAGAGVFPTRAQLGAARHVGEIVVRTAQGTVAGFENHSATTTLEGAEPFGQVVSGTGNDGGQTEGVALAAAIGTHLHGPVLPMNPALADRMLATALRTELAPVQQTESVDRYAANARRAIADRLGVKL